MDSAPQSLSRSRLTHSPWKQISRAGGWKINLFIRVHRNGGGRNVKGERFM